VIEPIARVGADAPPHERRTDAAAPHAARAQWRFRGSALRRTRLALSFARDLEVNPPGIALALDLIDEIDALRARLHRLGR
jgi:chaperone modulatory protein CbpM